MEESNLEIHSKSYGNISCKFVSCKQRCAIWSAILLGTTYWPFFTENPNSFVAIAIGITFDFSFGFVLLLLVLDIETIGLYSVYYWYCIVIVHYQTSLINGSNQWMVSRIIHILKMKTI